MFPKQPDRMTELTLIRLLPQEQSDLELHCLPRPVCPNTSGMHTCLLNEQKCVKSAWSLGFDLFRVRSVARARVRIGVDLGLG